METLVDHAAVAAGVIQGAGLEVAVMVAVAWLAIRWLLLGIRADLARLHARAARGRDARDEHAEAFDRGMQRLLAEIGERAEPEMTAYRRAA